MFTCFADTMITPSQIRDLLESPHVKSIEKMLDDPNLRTNHLDIFTTCRNYLMFRILVANGQRPGVLAGITPAAMQRAKPTEEGAVVTVSGTIIN